MEIVSWLILLFIHFAAILQDYKHSPCCNELQRESCCGLQNATTKYNVSNSTNDTLSIWLLLSVLCSQSQSLASKPDCCGFLNMLGITLKQQDLPVKLFVGKYCHCFIVSKILRISNGFPGSVPQMLDG